MQQQQQRHQLQHRQQQEQQQQQHGRRQAPLRCASFTGLPPRRLPRWACCATTSRPSGASWASLHSPSLTSSPSRAACQLSFSCLMSVPSGVPPLLARRRCCRCLRHRCRRCRRCRRCCAAALLVALECSAGRGSAAEPSRHWEVVHHWLALQEGAHRRCWRVGQHTAVPLAIACLPAPNSAPLSARPPPPPPPPPSLGEHAAQLWGAQAGAAAHECTIELLTGRTHQIRAQLSAAGCPLLGDSLYQPLASAELRQASKGFFRGGGMQRGRWPGRGQGCVLRSQGGRQRALAALRRLFLSFLSPLLPGCSACSRACMRAATTRWPREAACWRSQPPASACR